MDHGYHRRARGLRPVLAGDSGGGGDTAVAVAAAVSLNDVVAVSGRWSRRRR